MRPRLCQERLVCRLHENRFRIQFLSSDGQNLALWMKFTSPRRRAMTSSDACTLGLLGRPAQSSSCVRSSGAALENDWPRLSFAIAQRARVSLAVKVDFLPFCPYDVCVCVCAYRLTPALTEAQCASSPSCFPLSLSPSLCRRATGLKLSVNRAQQRVRHTVCAIRFQPRPSPRTRNSSKLFTTLILLQMLTFSR
jgi:hypothetical protein